MALENCTLCRGTGWKMVPRQDGAGGRVAVACDCGMEERASRVMERARIPKRYEHCDFESYVTDLADGKFYSSQHAESLKRAKLFAQSFVRDYPGSDQAGLLFMGNSGVGKTHLAIAAMKQAIKTTGVRAKYYDTRGLLTQIRSTYNSLTKTAEMDIIRPVMEADLLILDDLGAERLTDWVEETMNVIVNSRYNAKLPTIFTSNYEDVPDREEMNSLLVRVGFRLHSRLREMCEFLEYDGPDYRNLPPNAGAEDLYNLWKAQPRRKLPVKAGGQARAQLRAPKSTEKVDLKWTGGRAGS